MFNSTTPLDMRTSISRSMIYFVMTSMFQTFTYLIRIIDEVDRNSLTYSDELSDILRLSLSLTVAWIKSPTFDLLFLE